MARQLVAALLLIPAVATIAVKATPALADGATEKPASEAEGKAILDQYFKKKMRDLEKQKADALAYIKGKTAAQIQKAYSVKPAATPSKPSPDDPLGQFVRLGDRPPNPCGWTTAFYVRRDRLDTFQFREKDVMVADAKGLAVSFLRNDLAGSGALAINGRVGAVFAGPQPPTPCADGRALDPYTPFDLNVVHFGFAIAPFVDAQGTTTSPMLKTDSSALQTGIDVQASAFGGPILDHQYFIATPYYQTDFRGRARVEGGRLAYEPIASAIRLGGNFGGATNPYVDYFFQVQAEADFKQVDNVGLTGLAKGSYRWLGGTAQVHINPFPDVSAIEADETSPFPLLVSRLFVNGKLQGYWDEKSDQTAHLYEAEAGYNLTTDGKTAVSFKYDNGKDKDTLVKMRKYLVSLNYKY